MNAIVDMNADQIAALCLQHGVRRLCVFGSATTDEFDSQHSDIDFVVEFQPMPAGDLAEAYFGLLDGLEQIFKRRIDLVSDKAIVNPYFRKAVDETKVPIYAAA